jgi:hypothetical protein
VFLKVIEMLRFVTISQDAPVHIGVQGNNAVIKDWF